MQSKILQTTMDIIFWKFLLLYQIFFSPQVQQSVIISSKHGIYQLLEKLPSDLKLMILRNQERSRKSKNFILPMTTPRSKAPLSPTIQIFYQPSLLPHFSARNYWTYTSQQGYGRFFINQQNSKSWGSSDDYKYIHLAFLNIYICMFTSIFCS